MAEVMTPGSPPWWRKRLMGQLDERHKKIARLEAYYDGNHPVPRPPAALDERVFADACRQFRTMSQLGVTNWVKLVSDTPSERLGVIGFRFGDAKAGFEDDKAAWLIWQRNQLDADSTLVHDNGFQTGSSYVLVWPDSDQKAVITPEHSGQVIVAYEPGSRRQRVAALKRWVADDGRLMVTLYLPDYLYKWQTKSTKPGYGMANGDLQWEERRPAGEDWPLPNPLGKVPVVEFRVNSGLKPAPFGGGTGEFEGVLTIQDRINKTIFDRLVTAESQAFRQRAVIGWEPPLDPRTKKPDPRATYKASQANLWAFGNKDTKIVDLQQADFAPFIKAVEADVNAMAAITKTPPQYLLGAMVNISGDALTAAESGLVAKCLRHRDQLSESWEEVIQLALQAEGDNRSGDVQSMAVWRSPQFRSLAEEVDAVVKLKSLNLPDEVLWLMIPGTTPQDVARWKAMQTATTLLAPPAPAAPSLPVPALNGAGASGAA